jgi:excisionase family DNA binding protein
MGAKTGTESKRSMLVSLTAAASELGIPYSSLREVLVRGELKHVRLSGRGRYWVRRTDLDKFIENSTEEGIGQ